VAFSLPRGNLDHEGSIEIPQGKKSPLARGRSAYLTQRSPLRLRKVLQGWVRLRNVKKKTHPTFTTTMVPPARRLPSARVGVMCVRFQIGFAMLRMTQLLSQRSTRLNASTCAGVKVEERPLRSRASKGLLRVERWVGEPGEWRVLADKGVKRTPAF
jgi:hypothetical protein